MSGLHLGVDVGLHGSFVALSPLKGVAPISVLPMPLLQIPDEKGKKKPQVNTRAIVQWVLDIYAKDDTHIWIEKCPKHANSQASMRSLAINFGLIRGIFEARFPHMHLHRVRCGNELAGWQRQLLGTFKAEESKAKALELANQLWPGYDWPKDSKGRVLDGPVDSCLIAEHGRRQIEKDVAPHIVLPDSSPIKGAALAGSPQSLL